MAESFFTGIGTPKGASVRIIGPDGKVKEHIPAEATRAFHENRLNVSNYAEDEGRDWGHRFMDSLRRWLEEFNATPEPEPEIS